MSGKWDEARWSCGGAAAAKNFYRSASAAAAEEAPSESLVSSALIDKPKKSKRLKPDKWRAAFDRDGKLVGLEKVLKSILSGGIDHCIRGEVWEFLLGCYALGTTADHRQQLREARRKRYKELVELCQKMHASIGSGSLAYTVGSKVMDVRIMSKDSAKKEAKLQVENINIVASRLENLHEERAEQMIESSSLMDVSIDCFQDSVEYLGDRQNFANAPDADNSFSKEELITSSNAVYSLNAIVVDSDEASDSGSSEEEAEAQNEDYLRLPVMTLFPSYVVGMDITTIPNLQDSAKATAESDVVSAQIASEWSSFKLNSQEDRDPSSKSPASITADTLEGSPIDSERSEHNVVQTKPNDQKANEVMLGLELTSENATLNGSANYISLKGNVEEEKIADWLWTLHRIVVDVVRTDRHLKFYDESKNMARMSDILAIYAWIDPATGYCQGMSDLLSPFIVIFEEDADAFWCFESLLSRMRQNFQMEGPVGVMKQLGALAKILEFTDLQMFKHLVLIGADSFVFAFRMLLVLFRRELSFGEALCMWEMMWAADFDHGMPWALEYNCLEPLILTRSSSFLREQFAYEDNLNPLHIQRQKSPDSLQEQPLQASPPKDDLADNPSRSPFCGLGAGNFWPKHNRPKVRTVSSLLGKTGDDELSVFIVAAILILNKAKFLKEAQSMDDAIKMFNDLRMKIKVKRCIRTAINLRKKYRRQLSKRAAVERRLSACSVQAMV